jgi:hypothetical protein
LSRLEYDHAGANLNDISTNFASVMETNHSIHRPLLPFSIGLLLLVLYFSATWQNHWFQLDNFYYVGDPVNLFGIPPIQVMSMFWKVLLLLPAVVSLAWALSAAGFELKIPRFLESRKLPLLLSVLSLFILAGLVLFVFRATEVTDDELAYVFQAKTYLSGRLFNPPPPTIQNFANTFIINDGVKFIGKYQFGHPLLLAIGMMFGSEYIITLFMAAALIVLISVIARYLFEDHRVAMVSPLLLFASPFFYFVSSSRLSHISAAFLLALFFFLFLKISRADTKPGYQYSLSLLAGVAAGFVVNMRPMTALAFLLPFLFIITQRLLKKEIQRPLTIVVMGAGFFAVVALTLAYNKVITGAFLTYPMAYYDPTEVVGFGGQGHTIWLGIQNLLSNVARMNAFLFGFPLSLIFVFIALFKPRLELGDIVAFSIIACFAAGYLLVRVNVADLGPIYYYECIIPLVLLSARGFLWLHDFASSRSATFRSFPSNFLLLSAVFCLLTFLPERLVHFSRLTRAIDAPYAHIEERNVHHAIVFAPTSRMEGWVFGTRNNAPNLDNDVVLCHLSDAESNSRVLDFFKGRDAYVFLWYGLPLQYDLRKVTREELLSTKWMEELRKLWALNQPKPGWKDE